MIALSLSIIHFTRSLHLLELMAAHAFRAESFRCCDDFGSILNAFFIFQIYNIFSIGWIMNYMLTIPFKEQYFQKEGFVAVRDLWHEALPSINIPSLSPNWSYKLGISKLSKIEAYFWKFSFSFSFTKHNNPPHIKDMQPKIMIESSELKEKIGGVCTHIFLFQSSKEFSFIVARTNQNSSFIAKIHIRPVINRPIAVFFDPSSGLFVPLCLLGFCIGYSIIISNFF